MILLALDPGERTTGVIRLTPLIWSNGVPQIVTHIAALPNNDVFAEFGHADEIVCEKIAIPGRAGRETYNTAVWYGRFQERAAQLNIPFHGMPRASVCLHLYRQCPRPMPATPDARIRRALGARFSKDELKGVKGHAMAALALGVTFLDKYPAVRTVTGKEWDAHLERGAHGFERPFRGKR